MSSSLAAVKLIQFAWFCRCHYTGGFISHCNRCAHGLTADRRAGSSIQTLGPLLQYTECTKQRYTSYRDYLLTYLLNNAIQCTCLLYTSDAADEEDSVDLGGRRII